MADLAKLVVKLEAQSAQYTAELERANRKLDGFAKKADSSLKGIDATFKKIGQGAKALGVTALAFKGYNMLSAQADESIKNLAKSNDAFADSLKRYEELTTRATAAGQKTIEAQQKLNDLMAHPAMQIALKKNRDEVAALRIETEGFWAQLRAGPQTMESLEAQLKSLEKGYDEVAKAAIRAQMAELKRQEAMSRLEGYQAVGQGSGRVFTTDLGDVEGAQKRAKEDAKAREEMAKSAAKVAEDAAARMAKEADYFSQLYADIEDLVRDPSAYAELNRTVMGRIGEEQGFLGGSSQVFDRYMEGLQQMENSARETTDRMSVYADEAARQMQNAFADFLFDPFQDGLDGMLKGFADAIRQMLAQQAAAGVFDWLGGKAGTGGVIGAVGSFIAGARANGGPVSSGKSYLVGERGPELFTPGSSGHISPNVGGVSIVYNVDARGATQDAIALLPAAMKQASDSAVARVQQLVRQGRI